MYSKPPIQEAVLDIQAALPPESTADRLREFHKGLEARFPEERKRINLQHGVEFTSADETQNMAATRAVAGYAFRSAKDGKIVQARREGFTFNKLRPYSDWAEFSGEARELWEKYVALAKPANVSRVAVRYINRIEVPLPFRDFREYCLLFPDIPQPIPQGLTELFLRFVVPFENNPAGGAIVTVTFEPPMLGTAVLPLILDIDAYERFDILAPDTHRIWDVLGRLREFKNMIFETSLTAKTKSLFQ